MDCVLKLLSLISVVSYLEWRNGQLGEAVHVRTQDVVLSNLKGLFVGFRIQQIVNLDKNAFVRKPSTGKQYAAITVNFKGVIVHFCSTFQVQANRRDSVA